MTDVVTTVKIEGTGWIINDTRHVPNSDTNDENYIAIQDWITAGNVPTPEYADEAEELLVMKPKRIAEIRGAHNVARNLPVTVDAIDYEGGFDSAIKLDAVKRLSVLTGAIDVTFYDTANEPQLLTIADAETVIIAVSAAYQLALADKQSKLVLANAATTLAELPTI